MKKVTITVTCFALLSLAACKSESKEGVEKLEAEVMAVHDEVMPRMEELMQLKGQISEQLIMIDSTAKTNKLTVPLQDRINEGIMINQSLVEADSLMSEWMYQYKADTLKSLDESKATEYLNLEKQKISRVKEKTNQSIDRAKKYLESQP
ncbi:hypothetical protein [Tellurirhabdus bombi]|uniref:hypothetical protein n=1 Tax=Tellurirhabdus bombi TaxID=2907205 RepID=UPI001F4000C9|nr:hypothetical protein [Tellurirhabdus bombi]